MIVFCNKKLFFFIMYKLFKMLATLPVSTASAKRSFLTLKCLKTYCYSTHVVVKPLQIVNKNKPRQRLNLVV